MRTCEITHLQFRFVYDTWEGPEYGKENDDLEMMSAFYNYSEPFSAECRAFGRFKESGHEELAIQCFGYVLLDEEHTSAPR
jgi:Kinetochore Sim4 complex subunit FTA2